MLIEAGILLAAYAAIRIFEKRESRTDSFSADKPAPSYTPVKKSDSKKSDAEKKADTYLAVSVGSIGLGLMVNVHPVFSAAYIGATAYTSFPALKGAENAIFQKKTFDNDLLTATTIVMGLMFNYYTALALGVALYHLGGKIIARTRRYSENMIADICHQQSKMVWVLRDQVEIEIPFESVKEGELIIVNSGELIPADGFIAEGRALINEQNSAGRCRQIEKSSGDRVLAFSQVLAGRIHIKIETADQCTGAEAAKIDILLHAADYKTEAQLKGEEWADKAALPLLIFGGLTFPILGPSGALIVLNSKFGNQIRAVAPLGTLIHLKLALEKNIFIKDGRSLEGLNKVDTVLFNADEITCSAFHPARNNIKESESIVRSDIKSIAYELRRRGIRHICIVSRYSKLATERLAEEIGADEYHYDVSSSDKPSIVEEFNKNNRRICFVGDGIADAPAMKKAHFSISLRDASEAQRDAAQVIFTDHDLSHLPELFDISDNLHHNQKNSLIINCIPLGVNIIGAYFFNLGLITSFFIKKFFFLIGIGNSLLPLKTGIKIRRFTDESERHETLMLPYNKGVL